IVMIIPSNGKVASRVKRPAISKLEHPSSKIVANVAATSGGKTGTLYSSIKSCSVDCQLATFVSPPLRKTLATPSRNRSWKIESGNRSRNAVVLAILSFTIAPCLRRLAALIVSTGDLLRLCSTGLYRQPGPRQKVSGGQG